MPHAIEIASSFRAKQGLRSPTRSAVVLPSLDEADGRPFALRVGLVFADDEVNNPAGRAVDSDVISLLLQETTRDLSAAPWTSLFRANAEITRQIDEGIYSWVRHAVLEQEISLTTLCDRYELWPPRLADPDLRRANLGER